MTSPTEPESNLRSLVRQKYRAMTMGAALKAPRTDRSARAVRISLGLAITILTTQYAFAQQPADEDEDRPLPCVECTGTAQCPPPPPPKDVSWGWPWLSELAHQLHGVFHLHQYICTTPLRSKSWGDGYAILSIFYHAPQGVELVPGTAGIFYGNGHSGYQGSGTSTAGCDFVDRSRLYAYYRASNGYAAGYCVVRGIAVTLQ
jgi:hypothetical protein